MTNRIIFNADDFGATLGINEAVYKAYNEGILNAASIMINCKYAKQAIELSKKMKNMDFGLHLNLTNGPSLSGHEKLPLLTDTNGAFKNGFLKLCLLALFKPKALRKEVEQETDAQILKAKEAGIDLKHIDSHRHIHIIPLIFKQVLKLKEKYGIERIRLINENAVMTIKTNKSPAYLFDGGLVKYCLLKFFYIINGFRSNTYFYTMLYTCKLSAEHFKTVLVPRGFDNVEVMIHPSIIQTDMQHREDVFDENMISTWRSAELNTLLNKTLLQNFVFNAKYPWLFELYFKVENLWFKMVPEKLRFLLVGGFNTVFAYAVYALLLLVLKLPYLLALIVQYFITVNVSIATMRYYVFRSKGDMIREFLKAWSVYIGLFFANSIGLSFLVEVCKIDELWAQGIYLTFSTIVTYILHKYFSFKKIKNRI